MTEQIEQRSDDWFTARLGKVTASRVADVVAKTKSGYGASRERYMIQLIQETVSGVPAPSFKSSAMERGIEMEPAAIEAYEAHTLSVVEPAGFFVHPNIHLAGASPDGLVGDCGLVEVKCPESHTHLDTLIASQNPRRNAVRNNYLLQMQWQMACTGRQWCDFVSYDDRWPPHLRLYIERVPRDETLIAELEGGVMDFLDEMAERIKTLEDFKQ